MARRARACHAHVACTSRSDGGPPRDRAPPRRRRRAEGALTVAESRAGPRFAFPGGERAAFFVALALALYAAYRVLRPVLVVFLIACAVASISFPLYARLRRGLRGHRRAASALVVALIAA